MKFKTSLAIAFASALGMGACSYSPEEERALIGQMVANDQKVLKAAGYEIATITGYGKVTGENSSTLQSSFTGTFGGPSDDACYTLKKIPADGHTYKACVRHDDGKSKISGLKPIR